MVMPLILLGKAFQVLTIRMKQVSLKLDVLGMQLYFKFKPEEPRLVEPVANVTYLHKSIARKPFLHLKKKTKSNYSNQ